MILTTIMKIVIINILIIIISRKWLLRRFSYQDCASSPQVLIDCNFHVEWFPEYSFNSNLESLQFLKVISDGKFVNYSMSEMKAPYNTNPLGIKESNLTFGTPLYN